MRWVLVLGQSVLWVVLAATQSGCLLAAAAGGAGAAYVYDQGAIETTVNAGVERTVAAAKAAMDDLKAPLLSSYATGLEGKVEARVGTDNKATINVKSVGNNTSKVYVRIGTFGDEGMSRHILDRINAHLAAAPASTTPAVP